MLRKTTSAVPASLGLFSVPAFNFAGGKQVKPTPKDLQEYDIVVVGGNLGGILSKHIEEASHKHFKILSVFDKAVNECSAMRSIYEQQRCQKQEYYMNAKLSLDRHTAFGDFTTVAKYLPNENAIVLANGRRVTYKQLVIATGLEKDYSQIKGFEEAWADLNSPVFTCYDHPTLRANDHKYTRWLGNYKSGDAYFCIPSYPFSGEVGGYNFLLARNLWNTHVATTKLSPKHRFTVVNANTRFVEHFEQGDVWFKEKLQKMKIPVEYETKLVEVDKENLTAVFQNIKTGQRETRPFTNLYSLAPTRPNAALVESGLSTEKSRWMLDVDEGTLQHRRYKNIFGLGDVSNLPTTKSFWGGFYQIHVVRNNVIRALHGQSLNANYNGYTKNVVHLSQNSLTYLIHEYDQRASQANLLDSNSGIVSMLRYYFWSKFHRKRFMAFQLGKSQGPPYGKLGRPSFRKPAGEPSDNKIVKFFAKNKATSPIESH